MQKLVDTLSGTEHTKRFVFELTEEAFLQKASFSET